MVDGTGAPPRQADVGIMGGRIAFVGSGAAVTARRVIDATGQVVAPGFIDIHTHSDMSLLQDGRAQSKVTQGVTTEVTGNCGFSPFPINPEHLQLHLDLLAGIGDDAMTLDWVDLDGYRAAAESRGIAINIAPLVGHGALRIAAMGVKSGAASPAQLATMHALLWKMLDQGAFGLTTGLTVEDVNDWPDELAAVTAEDVMAAADLVLNSKATVTGWLLPQDAAGAADAAPESADPVAADAPAAATEETAQ